MLFGVVGRLGPTVRQADRVGDCLTGRGSFGYMGRPIVTKGDFVA